MGLANCGVAPGGGPTLCISGFGGGGGTEPGDTTADLGVGGAVCSEPAFGAPVTGAPVPSVLGVPELPGAFGAEAAGGAAPTAGFKFGLVTFGVVPGVKGGAPLAPGTGRAFAFGSASGVTFAGKGLPGVAPGVPGLIAGLIEALGGTGSFPCWIREARCATEGGRDGVAAAGVPPAPGKPLAAPAAVGPG
jgi:hypothetical protein